jgi:hypothetical protein
MTKTRAELWSEEIRDYLLGRMAKQHRSAHLRKPQSTEFPNAPIRRWWTFEGKRYETLGGPLCDSFDWVVQAARRLSEMFTPRLRLSERIEGDVDWPRTLARGPSQFGRQYIVRSSGIEPDEAEMDAVRGWASWIDLEWKEYGKNVGIDRPIDWRGFGSDRRVSFPPDQLRRWAHTCRRSRWPLLRAVIAESLRPVLESDELDRIPLPSNDAILFELLCLVRIARCLGPTPADVRWLSAESDSAEASSHPSGVMVSFRPNTLQLDGVTVYYQQSLRRECVDAAYERSGLPTATVERFQLHLPSRVDLAFDFEPPRSGFDGLIIEAKSGSQQFEHTLAQLLAYRAARPRRIGSSYLIWGIVEAPDRPDLTFDHLQSIFAGAGNGDVWVFSSAEAIPVVLKAAIGIVAVLAGEA